MKTTAQNNKNKSMYQAYRARTKSEIDCADLLSGLSQLDNQMNKYDQLRKQRLSQSGVFQEAEFFNPRMSLRLEQDSKQYSDSFMDSSLTPITQYQKVKPPSRPLQSTGISKVLNDSKYSKPQNAVISKQLESQAKQKQQKKQKINALRLKTKQLQQQYLQMYPSDILKRSTIAKQFGILLKLLQ